MAAEGISRELFVHRSISNSICEIQQQRMGSAWGIGIGVGIGGVQSAGLLWDVLFLPRICYTDTSSPQEDQYPPNIAVKVNHSYCSVPVRTGGAGGDLGGK